MDLLVLGLRSSDVVLGAHWLKQLGPILMDYQNLTMKFLHGEYYIELKGDTYFFYQSLLSCRSAFSLVCMSDPS